MRKAADDSKKGREEERKKGKMRELIKGEHRALMIARPVAEGTTPPLLEEAVFESRHSSGRILDWSNTLIEMQSTES